MSTLVAVAGVGDVVFRKCAQVWTTKSQAELRVPFVLSGPAAVDYVSSAGDGLDGLRGYMVTGIAAGFQGGNEYHRERDEIVFVSRGSVSYEVEDMAGEILTFELSIGDSLRIPPRVMHTYRVTSEGPADLVVIANTTFDPNDKSTHDTFGRKEWEKEKSERKAS